MDPTYRPYEPDRQMLLGLDMLERLPKVHVDRALHECRFRLLGTGDALGAWHAHNLSRST
ncbi:MAG: hypothetical protein OXC41_07985 [Gammaproteobacteria bacterium]|nr:hypothetical protein [Gammaproteobacteria bacterium]